MGVIGSESGFVSALFRIFTSVSEGTSSRMLIICILLSNLPEPTPVISSSASSSSLGLLASVWITEASISPRS